VTPEFENPRRYRFGVFELDLPGSTLRNRSGVEVHLQQQPFRLLALLVSRRGEVVGREEIRRHLWSDQTFVDFEHSVNFCIRQIRAALGDDAKSPRYIETLPRRGYRFIAPVEAEDPPPAVTDPSPSVAAAVQARAIRPLFAVGAGLVCLAILGLLWYSQRESSAVAVAEGSGADAVTGTAAPLAREAYIKGRYLWRKGTNANLEQALFHFEEAVRVDPAFAEAHAAIADTYQLLANQSGRSARDAFPKAKSAAERALSLAPENAEAKMVLGTVLFRFDWNWSEAEAALRSAVALNPASAAARHDYAWFLISMKRFAEGVAEMRTAHELDPVSLRANLDIGWALLRAGQVDEAITHLQRILELEPDFIGAQHCLEAAYTFQGKHAEAFNYARLSLTRKGTDLTAVPGAAQADPKAALESIWRWRLQVIAQLPVSQPYLAASYHALLGEREQAITLLKRAFEERDPSLVAVHVDTTFQSIRSDPRFEELLVRIGLPR
jgi:DNA-binding winged helix-turn-helix (wHTH) protein/tetratricopeptide (TPR) repeat protein